MIPLFLCPESGPPKTTKRPDLMQKQSLLNYKLTWVHHLSDTAGGVGETPNHSGAGHLLGVIKQLCVGGCQGIFSGLAHLQTRGRCPKLID